ncbi:hypothetical protein NDU88_002837 [Pleurodeles waltl]|uniref:Uncharacterized protein n=1 Tax=Pleurodeles waltl TaxID=8319 RepID=A0AAV7RCL4_PLEWA|nr:hypothetical protein NDU88_002837 [Pleurodeles waltl]
MPGAPGDRPPPSQAVSPRQACRPALTAPSTPEGTVQAAVRPDRRRPQQQGLKFPHQALLLPGSSEASRRGLAAGRAPEEEAQAPLQAAPRGQARYLRAKKHRCKPPPGARRQNEAALGVPRARSASPAPVQSPVWRNK